MLPTFDWKEIPQSVGFIAIDPTEPSHKLVRLQGYETEPSFDGKKFRGQRIFCECKVGQSPDGLLFKRGESEPTIFELT